MKCQLCKRRKALVQANDKYFGMVMVCRKCRREYYPTPKEEKEDDDREERRAERAAEFASAGDYW